MLKLADWAEENIPQGFTVFGVTDSGFNRKRLRTINMLERLNQTLKKRTRVAKIFPDLAAT